MADNKKLAPKRRFKEFQNTDAWEQSKLGDLIELDNGYAFQSRYFLDKPSGYVVATPGNVRINGGFDENGGQDYDIAGEFPAKYIFNPGDIFVTMTDLTPSAQTLGNPAIVPKNGVKYLHNQRLGKLTKFSGDIDFLFTLLCTEQYHKAIVATASGTTVRHSSSDKILSYITRIPQMLEQQKIGSFFKQLDNLISLHQRKLEKTKALKAAFLSEMFPAQGEREPKRRFAGFTGAWEQRKVKDVCEISTGKSNTQDRIKDGIYPFYVRSPIIERSNRYLYDEEAVLTVGDGVGTGKVYHFVNGKYDLHQRVYRMFDFKNGVLAKYFYHYFSNHFYDRVMAMTAKTSVDSVRYEMISEMSIEMPSEKEQSKIIDYLDNLDNLITLHQRKLEKLQNIKKAYLNEMFI